MIDPIYLTQLQRGNTAAADSTDRSRKDKSVLKADSTASLIKNMGTKDSASFNFNLKGDLQLLQESVGTVYQEVKNQLERYYGYTGEDAESVNNKFLPPEDASAKELVDFFSPENTSKRILDFATGFFELYKTNHADAADEEKVNQFSTLIGDAIKKGFKEAEKILGSFDELGKIGETISKTYDMVLKGLEEFRLTHLNELGFMPGETEEPIEEAASDAALASGEIDITG